MRLWSVLALTAALAAGIVFAQGRGEAPAGASPYSPWKRGLPADPGYFPIAVWLQSPAKASAYKAAGINLYVALWQGPTAQQLAELKAAGMPVIVGQSPRSLAFIDDPTIVGWMHGDEPDNAQEVTDPVTGKKGYGPCIPPAKIVADYEKMRKADPTRPILLNLGQGVANDAWVGRGAGAKLDDYRTYVQGGDITSFDVYPVADNLKPGEGDNLWYVSKGLDRLADWSGGKKLIWNCIECTRIGGDKKATPAQVTSEVWLALIHGSRGIIYFVHQFKPTFDEHALLDDPEMLRAVTDVNQRIKQLAPVLNSPTIAGRAEVRSVSAKAPIDAMVKQYQGDLYVFAVDAHPGETRGFFVLTGVPQKTAVDVVGENRRLRITNGRFEDDFRPYEAHVYRVR